MEKNMNKKMIMTLLVIIVFFLSGCGSSNNSINTDDESDKLSTFSSNQSLRDYILDQYSKSILPQYAYKSGALEDQLIDGAVGNDTAAEVNGSSMDSANWSTTNVQEKGVDEADVVKNNGRYIYLSSEKSIRIVDTKSSPAMTETAKLEVKGNINSLYIYGEMLVVLYIPDNGEGNPWSHAIAGERLNMGLCYWLPVNSKTAVMIVDVSDPTNPVVKKEIVIDGNLVSSRRIENKLYLVQQFLPQLPSIDYTFDSQEDKDQVISSNKIKLDEVTLDDLIPYYRTVGQDGIESERHQLVSFDQFYKPAETCGGSVVTLSVFDIDDLTADVKSMGLIADTHMVYASTHALYLASTQWNQDAYDKESYNDVIRTSLFKFYLKADGFEFAGTGHVKGQILNQFSLGEFDDVLRIATTTGLGWTGGGLMNNVYCVKSEGEKLTIIGKLENLAKGEKLYSARFVGKRGFLVTFVQVDPLFTLDLSDPYNPVMSGELKVPGFSTYIHPLSDDYLLTLGQDVELYNNWPWIQGIQLSIFDIRDFDNPKLIHQEVIGDRGTWSEALYNHKAITFLPSEKLLAIPVDMYKTSKDAKPDEYGHYDYSGLFIYRLSTEEGFLHLGTVKTHESDSTYYVTPWTRGIFMDDHVFAVQQDAIRSALFDANGVSDILSLIF